MINLSIILIVAIIIEGTTLFGRYIFKLTSKKAIYNNIKKRLGLKKLFYIHHFFTGIIIAVIFYYLEYSFLFNIGIGIALSDVIHHIILKIIEGRFEFKIIEKI